MTEKTQFDPRTRPPQPWSDSAESEILDGLRSGQTLYSLLWTNPHLPNYTQVQHRRRLNVDFAAKYDEAREEGQEYRIEEAIDHSHKVRGDRALSVAAGKYLDATVKVAEKLAPRRFSPLQRHAGHDGSGLTVQVVSWKDGGTLQSEPMPALIPKQDETKPEESTG